MTSYALSELKNEPVVVTVGTFDGVHIGHAELLRSTRERARELGVRSLVITFEPLPVQVLRPDRFSGRLSSAEEKLALLQSDEDSEVLVLPFTRDFSNQTAEDFLKSISSAVQVREMRVGEEFALGHDREGTIDRLQQIGAELGFEVVAMPRVERGGNVVSSSRIRSCVQRGDVHEAATLLGRYHSVHGVVQEGAKLGRTIGFPTANVAPPPDLVEAADGIYASFAVLGGDTLPAMTYIGTRPALNTGDRVIETHIFDFSADIYGVELTTRFVERLRPDANFPSVDALVEQMHIDEQQARQILSRVAEQPAIALN